MLRSSCAGLWLRWNVSSGRRGALRRSRGGKRGESTDGVADEEERWRVFPVDDGGDCQYNSSAYRLMTAKEPYILPQVARSWADSRGSFRVGSPLQTAKISPAKEFIPGASRAELGIFQRLTPYLSVESSQIQPRICIIVGVRRLKTEQ